MKGDTVGRLYEYDDWLFLVVAEADAWTVTVLALTDFGWRHKAGELVTVSYSSAVGQYARAVE